MRVRAFLLRTGTIRVIRSDAPPAETEAVQGRYASYVDFDSGIVDDWPSVLRFCEAKVWKELTLVDGSAFPLETHYRCKQRVYESNRTTFDPDGAKHDCPKSTKRK